MTMHDIDGATVDEHVRELDLLARDIVSPIAAPVDRGNDDITGLALAGDLFGLYVAPYYLSTVVAIPIWFKLSQRFGKHKTVLAAVFWFCFWAAFVPVIAVTPYSWYEPFEVPKLLAFLPSDMHAAVAARFEGIPTGKFLFFVILMCFKGSSIGASITGSFKSITTSSGVVPPSSSSISFIP